MKTELEGKDVTHRGFTVTSGTEEEKNILLNIWNNKGRPVMFSRDGISVSITIAPPIDEFQSPSED